jgi:hypothetical protein
MERDPHPVFLPLKRRQYEVADLIYLPREANPTMTRLANNRHVGITIAQKSFFLFSRRFLVILEACLVCLLHSPVP